MSSPDARLALYWREWIASRDPEAATRLCEELLRSGEGPTVPSLPGDDGIDYADEYFRLRVRLRRYARIQAGLASELERLQAELDKTGSADRPPEGSRIPVGSGISVMPLPPIPPRA